MGIFWSKGDILNAADLDAAFRQSFAGAFSPTQYNGDPTGATDSTAALTAAHSAAVNAGGTLRIDGKYLCLGSMTISVPVTVFPGCGFSQFGVLTINAPMLTSTTQIFFGTGLVLMSPAASVNGVFPDWWGAAYNVTGGIDDAPAINAAFASLNGGGGRVKLRASSALVRSPININYAYQKLVGGGASSPHNVGTEPFGSSFVWGGAGSGSAIINVAPAAGATQNLTGVSVEGVALNPGTGCDYGLKVTSASRGLFDVSGDEFNVFLNDFECSSTLGEFADCQHNKVYLAGKNFTNGGGLFCAKGTSTANFSFNDVEIEGNYFNGNAIVLYQTDSCTYRVHMTRAAGGTGVGIIMKAGAAASQFVSTNDFPDCSPGGGGVLCEGTNVAPYPATANSMVLDKGNGTPDPVFGSGATLFWSSNECPPGFRRYFQQISVAGQCNFYSMDSAGRIVMKGLTAPIAAGGNVTVTLPLPISGATFEAASVVAGSGTPPATGAILSSNTTAVISNTGTATASFFWEVEGL
jgi:hypothetical protein